VAKTKPTSRKPGQGGGPVSVPGAKPLKSMKGGGNTHVQRIQKPKAK
jgi:hypothetical protein